MECHWSARGVELENQALLLILLHFHPLPVTGHMRSQRAG